MKSPPLLSRPLIACACAVLFSFLAGCSTSQLPELEVAEVKVGERTDEGLVVVFTLSARNENAEPLPLKKIDYTLAIDGRQVFSGVRSPEATLRPNGSQLVRVPAVIRLDPGGAPPVGVHQYVLAGRLTYLEPGKIAELLFDSEVSQPSAPFEARGTLDFGP